MLDIRKISNAEVYTDEYWKERCGKITASPAGKLISEKSDKGIFSKSAMSYIEGLAGEILTGKPARIEFHDSNTDHGNATEPEGINYFCSSQNKEVFRTDRGDTHKLIVIDEYSSCTPDALVAQTTLARIFDETGTKLKAAPLEIKCPPVHHRFIKLFKCITPADLKAVEPMYYWQVMCQMIFCNSLNGYFATYNPDFPVKMRVIEFKKLELKDDLRFLNNTLEFAKKEIIKCVNLFK